MALFYLLPQLPKALALIPRHCLELFCQCAAYGQPALGIPTASGGRHCWDRAGLGGYLSDYNRVLA